MSELKKYSIRLHRQASEDIDNAYDQITAFSGTAYADDWQNGLRDFVAALATLSSRYPLADENSLFQNKVWAGRYQFKTSRVIYRVPFEFVDDTQESPYVYVLHIRHASRKPMTRAEAREIEDE